MTTSQRIVCDWCKSMNEPHAVTCGACGAPLDVRNLVSESGWKEAPRIKDMAEIHFGKSSCQIEGSYVPVADINLAKGESVYFAHHIFLWKEARVIMNGRVMPDAWKQEFAGMPLIMMEANGPGHIAFSKDQPGEIIALPLHKQQAVFVREHAFMLASGQVLYDYFNPEIWYATKDGGGELFSWPLGQFMDVFYAYDPGGLLLLHGIGNVFVKELADGESVLVKPTGLLFTDASVTMQLHIERPDGGKPSFGWMGQRNVWLRVMGPGRVAIQSVFDHIADNGRPVVRSSTATKRDW